MGTRAIRIAVLCGLLLLTGGISRLASHDVIVPPEKNVLSETVKTVGRWVPARDIAIDKNILDELKLNDYLFRSYTDGKRMAILYIGYYGTAKTVGASHDPLVCFPGQGWVISGQKRGIVRLPEGGGQTVNYSVLTATKGEERELILYWFQSHGETASGTVKQKVNTLLQKIQGKRGRNAFVRISVSIGQGSTDEANRLALEFLASFYPSFFDYIRS